MEQKLARSTDLLRTLTAVIVTVALLLAVKKGTEYKTDNPMPPSFATAAASTTAMK